MALNEQTATAVGSSGIDIAYERRGTVTDPLVLLIMGVAAQLIHWPEGFLSALLGRGLQIIRFDNRDAGHTTHFHEAPMPNLPAALAGDYSSAPRTSSAHRWAAPLVRRSRSSIPPESCLSPR